MIVPKMGVKLKKKIHFAYIYNFTPQKYDKFLKPPNVLTLLTFVLNILKYLHNPNIIFTFA